MTTRAKLVTQFTSAPLPWKQMIVAAQEVAFQHAATAFQCNPSPSAWKQLETEMWAWQCLKQIEEEVLVDLLKTVAVGYWSEILAAYHKLGGEKHSPQSKPIERLHQAAEDDTPETKPTI